MSCEPHATYDCIRPDEVVPFELDLEGDIIRSWQGGKVYVLGERVRPGSPNGFEYECTTAGQTKRLRGIKEPSWPTTIGQTVVDGSVVWTARALSGNSLARTISGVTYEPPTGVTLSGTGYDLTGGRARLYGMFQGVTASMDASIIAHITYSDTSHEDIVIQVKGYEAA